MTVRAAWPRPALWAGAAVLSGMAAATLPVAISGAGLGLAVIIVLAMIEPALGLVVMLGIAPLKTLIATEAALPLDAGQIGLALASGAWLIRRMACRPHAPLPRTRLYLLFVAILLGFTPSLLHVVSIGAALSEMLKWIEMLLLIGIVLDLRSRWPWIAFGVVLAGVLQAIIGLYEFQGGSGAAHLWIDNYRRFRAFGTFGQPNPFSAFMGLTLPLAVGLAWGYAAESWAQKRRSFSTESTEKKTVLRRAWQAPAALALWYAMAAGLLLGGLIASWGRGAWLGFGAAMSVMVFLAPRRRWRAFLLLALAGTISIGMWLTGSIPRSVQGRLNNALTEFVGFGDVRGVPISDENFAIVERLAHWQAALAMASDEPFIGVGLGNYEAVYAHYRLPSWPRALGHAHNDYLNTLAETGLVGLTVYLLAWGTVVLWTVRALRQHDSVRRGLVLGLAGTWTHLAVHSVVDKLYVNNLFLHIGVLVGLLAVVLAWQSNEGNQSHDIRL